MAIIIGCVCGIIVLVIVIVVIHQRRKKNQEDTKGPFVRLDRQERGGARGVN